MQKKKADTVDVKELPEVVQFIDAQAALEDFKAEHPEVFQTLAELTEKRNTLLEAAEKACRANQVSCGPFDLYQFTTKYDAEALYNAIGRDKFLEVGGKIESKTVYAVDRTKLEAAAAQRKVPEDVMREIRTDTPNYHKPPVVVLP